MLAGGPNYKTFKNYRPKKKDHLEIFHPSIHFQEKDIANICNKNSNSSMGQS